MSTINKIKKPKTPRALRKKTDIIIENDVTTNIVSNTIDTSIEKELIKHGFVPINTISIQNDKKVQIDRYIKALNKMGQKVYILLDVDNDDNLDADLRLIETKKGHILPYSYKLKTMNIASMDVSGVAIECDKKGLCVLSNTIQDCDDYLTTNEAYFTFLEPNQINTVVENEGCYLSYPVVKLSEIRVNNQLVVEGTNVVTKKLRCADYQNYIKDLGDLQTDLKELNDSYIDFKNVIDANACKIKDTIKELEEYSQYYIDKPPCEDCDYKKYSLIKHNLMLRNDYNIYLLCGMKRIIEQKSHIDYMIQNLHDLTDFFEKQLCSLDMANQM